MTLDCKEWIDEHKGTPDMLDRVDRAYPDHIAAEIFNNILH